MLVILLVSFVFGCEENNHDLGNGYKLYADDGGYTVSICDSVNTQKISNCILDYKFDDNFIVALQSPPDSLPPMKRIIYMDADRKKIASNNKIFKQYWIINKKEKEIYSLDSLTQRGKYSNIYGPYNKPEYLKQCQVLKVPDNLKLEN